MALTQVTSIPQHVPRCKKESMIHAGSIGVSGRTFTNTSVVEESILTSQITTTSADLTNAAWAIVKSTGHSLASSKRIHTRQNIYDGTWKKTPSMGWMFVPLTQYHGGGAEATIEPLDKHCDHYEIMMRSNLGLGVQACYRGPRLYDTEKTKKMVTDTVAWYKKHRAILESDLIHGRRADGLDIDWMLHVNPKLDEKAFLSVYNPIDKELTKTIMVPLYYAGLRNSAKVSNNGKAVSQVKLDTAARAKITVTVPAQGYAYYIFN